MNSLAKSWYIKIILFFTSIGYVQLAYAQTSGITYSFINYNVNQGLPSSEVYDLYQNPNTGIMWIATDRGLVKYDGYDFTTYTLEDGLTNNVILNLTPDGLGNIWCQTLNFQPCYIDYKGGIHPFRFNLELMKAMRQKLYPDIVVPSMHFAKNKSLYLSSKHSSGQVIVDSLGKISWDMSLQKRRFLIFFPNESYYYYSSSPESKYSYPIDTLEVLYPGMMHKINDTTFLLTDGNSICIYKELEIQKKILSPYPILHSGKLNEKMFWISYRKGGVDFLNLSGEIKYSLLENNIITDVNQDHEGGIWFSTISNGIYYLKNTRIKTLNISQTERLTSISSIGQQLFLGYYNGDVFCLNSGNLKFNRCPEFQLKTPVSLQGDTIKKRIYTTSVEGLNWLRTDKDSRVHLVLNGPAIKVNDDSDMGVLFLCGYDRFVKIDGDSVYRYFLRKRVNDITILNKKIMIAGNWGLYSYKDSLLKVDKAELNFRIDDIDKFRNGIVCASLGGGFIFYNEDTLFTIKKQEGLLSNLTTEIFVQNDSTIWLATTGGANKIVFDSKFHYRIYSYTVADGLVSNEVIDIDMSKEYIWIATKKGLNFIDKNDQPAYQSPNLFLAINKVISNNQPISFSTGRFQLDYDYNNLEIFFNAVSFSRNQSLIYSYQLLPNHTEWRTTSNRSVVFPALAPGNYQLKIRASVDNIHWSEDVNLAMTINPPYWKTWWFTILLVVGSIGVLQLIFMVRLKQQKLKTNILETEMKALRAQMNPHFIFNSMASIQNFILKGNMDDSNKYLTKFSKLIRGVLENSKTELISIKKELDILSLYIELEQLRVKPFEYRLEIDPEINIKTILIPPMILQPFIENAIWHGIEPSGKSGILQLSLHLLGNKLYCRIEDNGVGREYRKTELSESLSIKGKSFGTEITRERINALKKTQNIDVELTITDKVDENLVPTGTLVEITLPIIDRK